MLRRDYRPRAQREGRPCCTQSVQHQIYLHNRAIAGGLSHRRMLPAVRGRWVIPCSTTPFLVVQGEPFMHPSHRDILNCHLLQSVCVSQPSRRPRNSSYSVSCVSCSDNPDGTHQHGFPLFGSAAAEDHIYISMVTIFSGVRFIN